MKVCNLCESLSCTVKRTSFFLTMTTHMKATGLLKRNFRVWDLARNIFDQLFVIDKKHGYGVQVPFLQS